MKGVLWFWGAMLALAFWVALLLAIKALFGPVGIMVVLGILVLVLGTIACWED